MILDASKFLFSDSAKEAINDVNTVLNLRLNKKQKPAVILHANKLIFRGVSFNVSELL